MVESKEKVKFFDPHFHIANWAEDSGTGHSPMFGKMCHLKHMQAEEMTETEFAIKDYEDLFGDDARTEHIGGMFIECGGTDKFGEVVWVDKNVATSEKSYGIIGGCDLT